MPNKTEEYLALACKTADSFSRQWEHWAEFLITAKVLASSWRMWPENLCSPTGTTTAVTSSASLTARIFCRT